MAEPIRSPATPPRVPNPEDRARYETIADWAHREQWTRGAELGVFDGATFLYLLEHCPALTMIGVDVWGLPGFSEGPTKSGEKCRCRFCEETRARRRALPTDEHRMRHVVSEAAKYGIAPSSPEWQAHGVLATGKRGMLYRLRTTQAAAAHEQEFDFVFIDGDHSTEGVSADIAAWLPKIKPGGILIGHDWNMKSVRDGIAAHFEDGKVFTTSDHVWYVPL